VQVMFTRSLLAALLSWTAVSASAQLFPQTGLEPPPPVTPIGWKWDRVDKDTYFYFSSRENGPLVLALPGAPGKGTVGMDEYLQRYFVDEGYALGILDWRGDFSRTAKPSAIVARGFDDLARIRGKSERRFDPTRIVLLGMGEGAFLAMLLSAEASRLQSMSVPPSSICATVLIHPMKLDATNADSYLAQRQFSAEPQPVTDLSPLHYASSAPPALIMTEQLDAADEKRGDAAAAVLKQAGRNVVQATYARQDERNNRTYLGLNTNPATLKLGEFLRAYCPAKKP
jgi:hypothetical protein